MGKISYSIIGIIYTKTEYVSEEQEHKQSSYFPALFCVENYLKEIYKEAQ